MATYQQLQLGSSGEDVEKLQGYLNQVGNYGLDEDGVYGPKTQASVKDYQSRNNLTVDGIAGNQTLGHLYSRSAATNKTNTGTAANTAATVPDHSAYQYDPASNSAYTQAQTRLDQTLAQKPVYQATHDQQLQTLYDQYTNREDFTYDVNADALYQQYKDLYIAQGQLAMQDAMGQAAALTGGYGNSYAQSVGQQAYQSYLQQLSAVVPELYGMAYDRYTQEGQDLLNRYAMVNDMANTEYARYQDALNQYWQNVSYLQSQADSAYDRGYNNWYNAQQMSTAARDTAYNNLVSLITSTGYSPTDSELAAAGMTPEQANAYGTYYTKNRTSGSSSSSGSFISSSGYNPEVAEIQKKLNELGANLTVDGIWGELTQAAYEKYMGGKSNTFTGTTYKEGVAYLQAQGVSVTDAASILTEYEWKTAKANNSPRNSASDYDTYQEYLADEVEARLWAARIS